MKLAKRIHKEIHNPFPGYSSYSDLKNIKEKNVIYSHAFMSLFFIGLGFYTTINLYRSIKLRTISFSLSLENGFILFLGPLAFIFGIYLIFTTIKKYYEYKNVK